MLSSSAHSSACSHSSTESLVQLGNNINEHKDTLSHVKGILSQPDDISAPLTDALGPWAPEEDNLPYPADALSSLVPEDNPPHSADDLSPQLRKDTLPHLIESLPQPEDSTMPGRDRSQGRNVHIFDASNRNTSIGGLILTSGITNTNFYSMVEIIVQFTSPFILRDEGNITIEKDNDQLQAGNYYIYATQPFQLSDELVLSRTLSIQSGTRVQAFRDAVRKRDRRCVITREEVVTASFGLWAGFEAAHIFPLAYEQYWKDCNYARWIESPTHNGGAINSVQNGLLLRSDIHQLFDLYYVSINPDDNYKIVCFVPESKGLAGTYFDEELVNNTTLKPPDQLLRWHFRQAVLTNMRGAGEPIFEHDFPSGSDMIGNILNGPKAAERMEFELFNRLATQFDLAM